MFQDLRGVDTVLLSELSGWFVGKDFLSIWIWFALILKQIETVLHEVEQREDVLFQRAQKLEIHRCAVKTLVQRIEQIDKELANNKVRVSERKHRIEIEQQQIKIISNFIRIMSKIQEDLRNEVTKFKLDEKERQKVQKEYDATAAATGQKTSLEDEISELFNSGEKFLSRSLLLLYQKYAGNMIPQKDTDNFAVCGIKTERISPEKRDEFVRPFQKNLSVIVSPKTNVPRGLLVYHEPGAGKNCEMSHTISTYFKYWVENDAVEYDSVVLFLSQKNHIKEILNSMELECGSALLLENFEKLKNLSTYKKGNDNFRKAKLGAKSDGRKFTIYIQILGRTMTELITNLQQHPDRKRDGLFEHCIVLVDEAHHIFKTDTLPDIEKTKSLAYKPTLLLRKGLLDSWRDCKVFLFTGTPIGDTPSDLALLNLVKSRDDEGNVRDPFPDELLDTDVDIDENSRPGDRIWTKIWERGVKYRNEKFQSLFLDNAREIENEIDDDDKQEEDTITVSKRLEGELKNIPQLRSLLRNCISYYDPGFGTTYPRLQIIGDIVYSYKNSQKKIEIVEPPAQWGNKNGFWTGQDDLLMKEAENKQISELRSFIF